MKIAIAIAAASFTLACSATEGDVLTREDGGRTVSADASVRADAPLGEQPDARPGELPDARVATSADASTGCPAEGACPTPRPGEITVCGHAVDLATSAVLGGDAVTVRVFDLLELTTNPNPSLLAAVEIDACGWFAATEIDPFLPGGVIVVTTDDTDNIGGEFRRVASLVQTGVGQAVRINAFALRSADDRTWANAAGIGPSFADRGAVLPIFVDLSVEPVFPLQGGPISGVRVQIDENPIPGQDHYFSDPQPDRRNTIAPAQNETGIDGSALVIDILPAVPLTGSKAGCSFTSTPPLNLPGMVNVQEVFGSCQ